MNESAGEKTEKLVNQFCTSLFIKHWTFPNPKKEDNKEVCDCLVVFHSAVIIVSTKDCSNAPDEKRWRKKAIVKSTRQILGAENYISKGGKVYTRNGEYLAIPKDSEIIRIGVAFGRKEGYSEIPKISSPEEGKIIHWFDDSAFQAVFKHTLTFSNFLQYLGCRERVCQEGNALLKDLNDYGLLAMYLNQNGCYAIDALDNGQKRSDRMWKLFLQSEEYDSFLKNAIASEKFCEIINWIYDQLHKGASKEDADRILSEFAALPMKCRRFFVEEFMSLGSFGDRNLSRFTVPRGDHEEEMGVVLLIEGNPIIEYYSSERNSRRQKLIDCCSRWFLEKNCSKCIGLATNKRVEGMGSSIDACIISRDSI